MLSRARVPSVYSRTERLSDAAVHVAGIVSALIAVPVLITLSVLWFGDRGTVAAAAVYGATLLAMLCCSAIYNMAPLPGWKNALRRLDQSAIYLKIAGTYTPFAVLTGTSAGMFLTGVWSGALVGVSMVVLSPARLRWASLALYLGLGWAGVVAGQQMIAALSPAGHALTLTGGALYTLGLVFFLWERLPFHNTIWHVFVLAATWIIYAAVLVELWGRVPVA